jgi:hypothetical protein
LKTALLRKFSGSGVGGLVVLLRLKTGRLVGEAALL